MLTLALVLFLHRGGKSVFLPVVRIRIIIINQLFIAKISDEHIL